MQSDLTGIMFAKFAVAKAILWLSRFERIPNDVKKYAENQSRQARKLKVELIKNFNSSL